MSDDYFNFISAQTSTLKQKFTSLVPYYSNLHFRPLWFLSINFSLWLNKILDVSKDNFILFRIENLIYFYTLVFIAGHLLYRISKKVYLAVALVLMCLLYPNNLNDICWTAGKVDLLCGIFLFLSLNFIFSYIENESKYKLYFIVIFFSLALFTKETAVILPLITVFLVYLIYSREKIFEIKNIIGLQIFVLIIYFSIRIFILGVQPAKVVTQFQKPGIFSSSAVLFKALISLIIPYDFLSIQDSINNENLFFAAYMILVVIFLVAVLFIFVRTNNYKYIILLSLIFISSIIPNLIAGYFRPQLILIPFVIFAFSLLAAANNLKVNLKFYAVTLILIFIFWGKLSFDLIKEWKLAYEKSSIVVECMLQQNFDPSKRNIILGLPSRYRQAGMLDYAAGAYNYHKYGEFKFRDKIEDLVFTGALDTASLNSEISVSKLSETEYEFETTGETQYFMRLDAAGNKYKDKNIEFKMWGKNLFRKPTVMRLRLVDKSSDIYVFSKDRIIKLNE